MASCQLRTDRGNIDRAFRRQSSKMSRGLPIPVYGQLHFGSWPPWQRQISKRRRGRSQGSLAGGTISATVGLIRGAFLFRSTNHPTASKHISTRDEHARCASLASHLSREPAAPCRDARHPCPVVPAGKAVGGSAPSPDDIVMVTGPACAGSRDWERAGDVS